MSKQFYENALEQLKRANKERKVKLAIAAGYATVEEYKKFLETKVSGTDSEEKAKINLTDMVIAFDTTGSMGSYIDAVKKHVKNLIPRLFSQNPGLKLSVIAFGDYCDMENQFKRIFGNAYQVIGLTDNENDLINFVNGAKRTGGGDTDEFYELVIKKITEETEWREGSNKSVLLIADYGPHDVGYKCGGITYNIDWREEANKAKDKGIIFDTLQILPKMKWYKELSDMTGGICLPFADSNKTSDLLEATSLARGGEATKAAFMSKSVSKEVTEDSVMSGVYGMYKNVVK